MRVISGEFKGKRLFSPADSRVRPTTDRIKETLFNILTSKGIIGDITVLDMFGGSGALGIEALSRGARKVIFLDRDPDSIKLIRKNLDHVGASSDRYEVYGVDFAFGSKRLREGAIDLVLADPPYSAKLERKIVETVHKYSVLSKSGILLIEHDSNISFDPRPFCADERKCGNTTLSFLSYPEKEAHNE